MTDEFIEQKFKELFYMFGEEDFNVIKNESWDLYINENHPYNKKQLEELRTWLKGLLDELTDKSKS
jgi:hypothetical protein